MCFSRFGCAEKKFWLTSNKIHSTIKSIIWCLSFITKIIKVHFHSLEELIFWCLLKLMNFDNWTIKCLSNIWNAFTDIFMILNVDLPLKDIFDWYRIVMSLWLVDGIWIWLTHNFIHNVYYTAICLCESSLNMIVISQATLLQRKKI